MKEHPRGAVLISKEVKKSIKDRGFIYCVVRDPDGFTVETCKWTNPSFPPTSWNLDGLPPTKWYKYDYFFCNYWDAWAYAQKMKGQNT